LRTVSGSSSQSSTPRLEFSSSTSPMASMRRLSLVVRLPSPRPVVPASPVRVTILDRRLPLRSLLVSLTVLSPCSGGIILLGRAIDCHRHAKVRCQSEFPVHRPAFSGTLQKGRRRRLHGGRIHVSLRLPAARRGGMVARQRPRAGAVQRRARRLD